LPDWQSQRAQEGDAIAEIVALRREVHLALHHPAFAAQPMNGLIDRTLNEAGDSPA
jgi:hypothetical protein